MQAILDSTEDVEVHKHCYCRFISKDHIRRLVAEKRKSHLTYHEEVPVARVRRSQVMTFYFREQCLFCGNACKRDHDPKHPDRWDRVVQCERAD